LSNSPVIIRFTFGFSDIPGSETCDASEVAVFAVDFLRSHGAVEFDDSLLDGSNSDSIATEIPFKNPSRKSGYCSGTTSGSKHDVETTDSKLSRVRTHNVDFLVVVQVALLKQLNKKPSSPKAQPGKMVLTLSPFTKTSS